MLIPLGEAEFTLVSPRCICGRVGDESMHKRILAPSRSQSQEARNVHSTGMLPGRGTTVE